MDMQTVLENIVRVGTVCAVDPKARKARVEYDDIDIISGWLFVVQHFAAGVYVAPDNEHAHVISDTYTGGGSAGKVPNHDHPGTHVTYWMPKMNDRVLVLYYPVFNGDGFVLGGL